MLPCREGTGLKWIWLTATQYIKAMRLFKEEPKWTPLNRSEETDENHYRKEYLTQRQSLAA